MTQDAGSALVDAGLPECPSPMPSTRVWLVGDSTVASGSGWGDAFTGYLGADAESFNRGRSGRSSRSYYEEPGSWWRSSDANAVVGGLRPGDYVLLQFGHNDPKTTADRFTEPGTPPGFRGSYREYLERYVTETRAAGAIPLLVTSVSRMRFDADDNAVRTHGQYPAAMRQIAADTGVALLDLEERSFQVFDRLGETETLERFADVASGDRTHFPPNKAEEVTKLVVSLLAESSSPLRCYLR